MKRIFAVSLCVLTLTLSSIAEPPKPTAKKSSAGPAPDKAFLQKIWDGWATLDTANVAKFYASGPHTFFDIAPLKYDSWDEYEKGVKVVLAGYKSAKFTVNDDASIHPHGDLVWATATVKEEMTTKTGKVEMGNFRWTVRLGKSGRQVADRPRTRLRTVAVGWLLVRKPAGRVRRIRSANLLRCRNRISVHGASPFVPGIPRFASRREIRPRPTSVPCGLSFIF